MFLVLWEYEVKPGCEKTFAKAYGPQGDWAKLFRTDPHYHETRLMRDSFHPAVHLTLDFWDSRQSYEEFIASHAREYKKLDTAGEELTVRERRIGWYQLLSP